MDINIFFPGEYVEEVLAAKAVCHRCPVRAQCYEDNRNETQGVYGGTTPSDRHNRIGKGRRTLEQIWDRDRARLGLPPLPRPVVSRIEQRAAVWELADRGVSTKEISEKLDIPRGTVWSILNRSQRVA
jgi:hypothetical protein